MKSNKLKIIIGIAICFNFLSAEPPMPELGKRWILNHQYSDEFEGNSLDRSKWRDYFKNWKGRSPAKFVPEAVSVKDGYLQIKNGVLNPSDGQYTIAGGAVQSNEKTAHFGYYEASFKASRIAMSTTFWMSNDKVPVDFITKKSNDQNCPNDKFSQELDICESIGGEFNGGDKFRTQMNFNTHYRYIDCDGGKEKFYSRGNNAVEGSGIEANAKIPGESWENFNSYGVYWKDANEFDFYVNSNFAGKVFASSEVVDEPFPRPMGINMVTETYDWARPVPTNAQLNDNSINTSYYDWVRSYVLIPADSVVTNEKIVQIYNEQVLYANPSDTFAVADRISFVLVYKSNRDRLINVKIRNANNIIIKESVINIMTGYSHKKYTIALDTILSEGKYSLEVDLRDKNGLETTVVSSFIKDIVVGSGGEAPDPGGDTIPVIDPSPENDLDSNLVLHSIPGLIEAENYKFGGEGVAYHDVDFENRLGQYREDGVDIEICGDSLAGYNIGWIADQEWLAYDVVVDTGGYYDFKFRTSSLSEEGKIQLKLNNKIVGGEINLPITGNWQQYQTTTLNDIYLDKGKHELRVEIIQGKFNFNYMEVKMTSIDETGQITSVLPQSNSSLNVFPLHVKNILNVHTSVQISRNIGIALHDLHGDKVASLKEGENDIVNLTAGIYFVVVKGNNMRYITQKIYKLD